VLDTFVMCGLSLILIRCGNLNCYTCEMVIMTMCYATGYSSPCGCVSSTRQTVLDGIIETKRDKSGAVSVDSYDSLFACLVDLVLAS
jgi:hypothetical protein